MLSASDHLESILGYLVVFSVSFAFTVVSSSRFYLTYIEALDVYA